MSEITLRELSAIGVDRLKGVGEKKLASLREVGVENVLDLHARHAYKSIPQGNTGRFVNDGLNHSGTLKLSPSSPPVMSDNCEARVWKAVATASVIIA